MVKKKPELGLEKDRTYVDDAVVGDLPARLQPKNVEGRRLLGAEVAERGVCDVVGLQIELVERGQELRDGADALVGHVDAVVDGDGDEARVQRGPQPLLRDLVTAGDLQLEEALQELHQRLESAVAVIDIANKGLHAYCDTGYNDATVTVFLSENKISL